MSEGSKLTIKTPYVAAVLAASLPIVTLTGVFPWGWDASGPIRWLLLPLSGWVLVALTTYNGDRCPGNPFFYETQTPGTPRSAGSWAELLWVALVLWGLVCTVTAVDRLHGWIGTPDRRLGWLTWLLFGALFWTGRRLDKNQRQWLVKGVVLGAFGLGLITLAERIGFSTNPDFAGSRLGGPFGQPAYLGQGAALAAPICVGAAVLGDRVQHKMWTFVAASAGFLATGALLASQARAAWLGALAATVVLGVLRKSARRNLILPIGVPLVAVLAVPDLQSRLASAGADGGVVAGRLDEWQVGLRALAASPLTGYGPEGYRTVFGIHVDADYVLQWGREVITDRAHSGALDTALAFGVPGFVAYVAIIGLVLWRCALAMTKGDSLEAGIAAGVAATLIAQQLLFPLSELDPLLWLLAGVATAGVATAGNDSAEADRTHNAAGRARSVPRSLVRGAAFTLAAITGVGGAGDVLADRSISVSLEARSPTQPERSLALRPDSIRYQFIASRLASAQGDLDLALRRIDDGLRFSPTDPALAAERATLLLRQAEAAQFESGGPSTASVQAARLAVDELGNVLASDPLRPDLLNQQGYALLLAGRPDIALARFEQSLELDPDNTLARNNLRTAQKTIEES